MSLPAVPLPTFSIVINTFDRAASLRQTLDSLRWLKYRGDFEVIVVNGPSTDASDDVIAAWAPRIRAGRCDVANLAISRNIGICMAEGDIVAFLDDDAIPEPEWLEHVAAAYDTAEVGGAGGVVLDHTGYELQHKYCLMDRLGDADLSSPGPMAPLSFPGSARFPRLSGTNASFRRSALLAIGGFDEEYEYFLGETDVCLRLVDAGYVIRQLPQAFVHHKLAPSNLRNKNRVTRCHYSIIKNKIYFTLKHATDYFPLEKVLRHQKKFIDRERHDVRWCRQHGLLSRADAATFESDVEKAVRIGVARGIEGPREMITAAKRARHAGTFTRFPVLAVAFPLSIVLVTEDYTPGHGGGIATFSRDLAHALAGQGHIVHVVTKSADVDRVDLESGVWVHRVLLREVERIPAAIERRVPPHIWTWSATALAEVRRIATHRSIDVVEAPIRDCQGIAFLLAGEWPLVTSLQTSLRFWLGSHPERLADKAWMASFGEPMLNLESELMRQSTAVRAISQAIKRDVETAYGFHFADGQAILCPLGRAADQEAWPQSDDRAEGMVTVLFVGRLEHHKGIDILLDAIPTVLDAAPRVRFRIIGEDKLAHRRGRSHRARFFAKEARQRYTSRVSFEGEVDDAVLHQAYATCDIVVSPGRYESFGLVLIEAMRAAKPVIGCTIGGIPEIIEDEANGLLVPPGDVSALTAAILRLARSPEQRKAMGRRGREIFEDKFTAAHMAANSVILYNFAKTRNMPRISYVNSACFKSNAVSNAIRDEIVTLMNNGFSHVRLYAYLCHYAEIPFTRVSGPADITTDPHFQASDLVVFHFGVYDPFLDLLPTVPRRAKRLVVFHNVTPKEFLPADHNERIDKTFAQMAHIATADHVICDSETNLAILRSAGIVTSASVLPLAVRLAMVPPPTKPSYQDGIVRLVFVGRFVRSKGPHELLAALDQLAEKRGEAALRLDLVGNISLSDPALVAEIGQASRLIEQKYGQRVAVRLHGDAGEQTKEALLQDADIFALPTYHEGFCVPLLEALASGCRLVVYENSNTPAVSNGFADLVPTGDVGRLAEALDRVVAQVRSARWQGRGPGSYRDFAERAGEYVGQFSPHRIGERFIDFVCRFMGVTALPPIPRH